MSAVCGATDSRRRVRRALSEDGLAEIAAGAVFVSAGLYSAAGRLTGAGVAISPAITAALALGTAAALRRKLVYPRVGFARPRTSGTDLAVIIVTIGLLVSAAGAYLVYGRHGGPVHIRDFYLWAMRALGLVAAVSAALTAWRTGLARFYIYAALFPVSAGVAWLLRLARETQPLLAMSIPGLAMIILGAVALARFLCRHPKPAPAETVDGNARS